LRGIDND